MGQLEPSFVVASFFKHFTFKTGQKSDNVWTILPAVSRHLSTHCVDNSGADVNDLGLKGPDRGLKGLAGIWTNET